MASLDPVRRLQWLEPTGKTTVSKLSRSVFIKKTISDDYSHCAVHIVSLFTIAKHSTTAKRVNLSLKA